MRRGLRLAAWILAGLLAGAVLLVVAALTVGRPILASLLADMLRAQGVPVVALTLDEIGWRRAIARDVVVDGGRVTAGRVVVDYDPGELLAGALPRAVAIEGGMVRVEIGPDGTVRLPFAEDGAAATDTTLPAIPPVTLTGAGLLVDTPYGPITLPLEGRVDPAPGGGYRIDAALQAEAAGGTAIIPVEGLVDADGAVDGVVRLSGERFAVGPYAVEGVRGRITALGAIGAALRLDAAVAIARIDGPGIALRDVGLVAAGAPERIESLLLRVRYAEEAGSLWVDLRAREEGTRLAVDADLRDLRAVQGLLPDGLPVAGAMRLQADATAMASILDMMAAPFDQTIVGALRLSAADLAVGREIRIAEAAIATNATLSGDSLVLTGDEPWRLAGGFGEPGLAADLAWTGGGDQRIAVTRGEEGWQAISEGVVSGTIDGYGVAGRLSAAIDIDPQGEVEVDIRSGILDFAPFALGGLVFEPGAVAVAGRTTADGWQALVSGDFALVEPGLAGFVRRATLSGGVDLRSAGELVEIRPVGCLTLFAPEGEPFPGFGLARPATGNVCRAGGPMLTWDGAQAAVDLALRDLAIRTTDGIELDWPVLLLSGDLERHIDITGVDGRVAVPADGISAEGLAVSIGWRAPQEGEESGGQLALGAVADRVAVPGVGRTLSAAAEAIRAGEALILTGEAAAPGTPVTATLAGRIDLESGRGRARIDIPELRLRPSGTQPRDIVPALGALEIAEFDGRLGAQVDLAWEPRLSLDIAARMSGASFVIPWGRATGAAGTFRVTGPWPVRLPAGQRLTIGTFDFGVPVTDVAARFAVDGAGAVAVDQLSFRWVGAEVEVAPFSTATLARQPARIRITGLELPRLLGQWPVRGLAATGILDGEIPFRLDGDTIFIDDGRLDARGPGVISYRGDLSEVAGDDNVALVTSALANFRYEQLGVALDGGTGGEAGVRLSIRGANPELYDGYPISLNVNLTGALYDIIRTSLATTRFGEAARELFERGTGRVPGR